MCTCCVSPLESSVQLSILHQSPAVPCSVSSKLSQRSLCRNLTCLPGIQAETKCQIEEISSKHACRKSVYLQAFARSPTVDTAHCPSVTCWAAWIWRCWWPWWLESRPHHLMSAVLLTTRRHGLNRLTSALKTHFWWKRIVRQVTKCERRSGHINSPERKTVYCFNNFIAIKSLLRTLQLWRYFYDAGQFQQFCTN